jgi:hemerythrin-like domain-containing protein
MPVATPQFHSAHADVLEATAVLRAVARLLPGLPRHEREVLLDGAGNATSGIEAHMQLDERVLYPEIARRLGDPLATASMSYDHRAIRERLHRLAEVDADDTAQLQELLYGLDALIRVHLWKEDELYLRMLDSPGWPADVAQA